MPINSVARGSLGFLGNHHVRVNAKWCIRQRGLLASPGECNLRVLQDSLPYRSGIGPPACSSWAGLSGLRTIKKPFPPMARSVGSFVLSKDPC